ncbi:hypothetical protein L3Q82_026899, partial [Scortum barcoo]
MSRCCIKAMARRAPGGRVFAHGTRPGSARNGDVGPPSSRLTTHRKVHEGPVQCGLGSSRGRGPRRPQSLDQNSGNRDMLTRYRQAKQACSPGRSWRQKLGSGRSSGEAMEEDYRSASKRFWQTVRRLRRGKQYSANTVYSAGWGAVDLNWGDIVGRWKKYFEDLLNPNPTDLPSNEEAEAGDSEVDSSITQAEVTEGDHTSQPPHGKVYCARVLERRIRPDRVDPRIQEEQCGFRPWSWNTGPALYPPLRVLEGLWEFAQPVHMCFVDLEKAFDRVPRGILWGVLRMRFLGVARGRRESWFGNHRISSLLFADDVVLLASSSQDLQHVLERFAAECEAAGMRISTSKSKAMVLDRKRVACPLRVGGEVLPQVEEFKYLGVLFTSEGKMEHEIDRRIGAASADMSPVVVKKELSRKGEALDLPGQSTLLPSPKF